MIRRQPNGFTLLEVMIGLVILAGISLAIFLSSKEILDSKSDTEARDDALHSVTLALNRISDDVNMAVIIKSKELLGANFDGELNFDGGEERMDFVSLSHLRFIEGAKEGELEEISYFLDAMPDDPTKKRLMRRSSPIVDKDLQQGGQAYPLLENIESVKFEYADGKTEELKDFKKEWKTKSADTGNKLPIAIKISIEIILPNETAKTLFSTLATTRINQGVLTF